mgnify:CR=1 FL=1
MNKVKTNYKQCAIATLSLWAIYLLVIVIGMSIYIYVEMQTSSKVSGNVNMLWLENLFYLSLPLIPSLLVFFVLIRKSFSRKNIFVSTSSVFVIVYNIAMQIWMRQDGMQNEQSFVGGIIISTILFLLISLYSWIALKIIKYKSK